MSRTIVLLRGVNVGGRNKLPMKTFAAILEKLGCENICTYIQSGNAAFDGETSAGDIAREIHDAMGFTPHVFLFSAADLRKAAAQSPFRKEAAETPRRVHVYFLDKAPDAQAVNALGQLKSPREDFAVTGNALYLHTPDGLASSKIADKIDRTLKTVSTARNWNTIKALLEMASAAS